MVALILERNIKSKHIFQKYFVWLLLIFFICYYLTLLRLKWMNFWLIFTFNFASIPFNKILIQILKINQFFASTSIIYRTKNDKSNARLRSQHKTLVGMELEGKLLRGFSWEYDSATALVNCWDFHCCENWTTSFIYGRGLFWGSTFYLSHRISFPVSGGGTLVWRHL